MPAPDVDPLLEGGNETPLQRCDRNLTELLQELRVIQTGVQVLFAFLLTAPLTTRFPHLSTPLRVEYLATVLFAGAAAVLLMAPTAHHRRCSAAATRSTSSWSPTVTRSRAWRASASHRSPRPRR
jgi:hypothetical protein